MWNMKSRTSKIRDFQISDVSIFAFGYEFGDALSFLSVNKSMPEVVVSTAGLDSTTIVNDKDNILKLAAKFLREDILNYASNLKDIDWPPNCETLSSPERQPLLSTSHFVTELLKAKDHDCSYTTRRPIDSYSFDLINGVTRGRIITLKHFLIGVGLHNLTGLKMPIRILSHLGHSVDYNVVCEIETAEAELAMRNLSFNEEPLEETFLTFWWADNFNQNIETLSEHDTKNSTNIVEFSEPNCRVLPLAGLTTIPRSKKRSLQAAPERIPDVRIDKKEPGLVSSNTENQTVQQSQCEVEKFNNLYEKWTTSRLLASKDQVEPNFAGFCVKSDEEGTILEQTKLTYLPPINAPIITDSSTICKIFEVIQVCKYHLCFYQCSQSSLELPVLWKRYL